METKLCIAREQCGCITATCPAHNQKWVAALKKSGRAIEFISRHQYQAILQAEVYPRCPHQQPQQLRLIGAQ